MYYKFSGRLAYKLRVMHCATWIQALGLIAFVRWMCACPWKPLIAAASRISLWLLMLEGPRRALEGLEAGPPNNAAADRCKAPHQAPNHWNIQLLKQEKLLLCSAGHQWHRDRGLGYKTQTAGQPGQLLCHTMMVRALSYNVLILFVEREWEKVCAFQQSWLEPPKAAAWSLILLNRNKGAFEPHSGSESILWHFCLHAQCTNWKSIGAGCLWHSFVSLLFLSEYGDV